MEPWYKVATPRKEVREGRSFNPDEFAIALEQVVAGTAPEDYRDPAQFFSRTVFTRALREHAGMVLRRLAGITENTAPVLTLITQFGGGKTHTLTALYHLGSSGEAALSFEGVADLVREAGLASVPRARVGVFVGNAWDPQPGRETVWVDLARQIAGDAGVEALGPTAREIPPGTEAIGRVFQAAGAPVLLLFDEVLNFLNRHRAMAEHFHAFIQNLTVATTGTTHGAAVISLPRSQVEMTDWDLQWQDRISKVVRRVAKDLIANDETEIGEVVRRRLFEDLGSERVRRNVAAAYAEWCFERRAQLPPEWTAVDTASTEAKARDHLRRRFESCYPFHPATLSVFQRKWQALPQYQQTRGTLAMLAQWISIAGRESFRKARTEPLITLGSAPLFDPGFRSVVLGQLGEPRLVAALDADIAGQQSHARALDADTSGPLRDIHRRVGTAILFESSGGQTDKSAHLPELRFALGEPEMDTTSIDNAAITLESRAYFIRRVGSDGFRISHQPTLKKVVSDRRASLDEETEIRPAMRRIVGEEFRREGGLPIVLFPQDGTEIPDVPRLTLVVGDPELEWTGNGGIRRQLLEWIQQRGSSPRLYPAALVWCLRKPGRDLRDKVELWLAWKRVSEEIRAGTLGGEFAGGDLAELHARTKSAEEAAQEEVWAGYRFVVFLDRTEPDGLKVIDLGAGHASSAESLSGRVIAAMKAEALLNESIGAGYLERNWPPALKQAGEWPLSSVRRSFLDGSLTRLLDPDRVLREKIPVFVEKGDFGLASGRQPDGGYQRIWHREKVGPEEIVFEADVYLLTKDRVETLRAAPKPAPAPTEQTDLWTQEQSGAEEEAKQAVQGPEASTSPAPSESNRTVRVTGVLPAESWNRLGTKLIPKLRAGTEVSVKVELSAKFSGRDASRTADELRQVLKDLGIGGTLRVEES
jgi:hypothetical protein